MSGLSQPHQSQKTELSGFVLERTAKRLKLAFKRVLGEAKVGVTVDQWVILQELQKEEGLSQYTIAERVFKDAPTVTRIIDLLCQKGLTERQPDPEDRRRFSIHLTAAGREKIGDILPLVHAFRERAWAGLDDQELNRLSSILNTIFNNLES